MFTKFRRVISEGSKLVKCVDGLSRRSNPHFAPLIASRRYYPQLPKRFYAEVSVSKNDVGNAFEINLDHRKLKTPGKQTFQVKDERLALAICQEWASQGAHIQQSFMHLTSLANTVQDNPLHKTTDDLIKETLEHLPEDTILYRVPESNNKLLEFQTQKWDPIIRWFEIEYKAKIPIVHGTVFPPEIELETLQTFRNALSMHSFEALQGLTFAMSSLRSVILTMGIAKEILSVGEAVELSRLETTFQIDHWGKVEWAHDLEHQETLSRVSAGMLFYSFHCDK